MNCRDCSCFEPHEEFFVEAAAKTMEEFPLEVLQHILGELTLLSKKEWELDSVARFNFLLTLRLVSPTVRDALESCRVIRDWSESNFPGVIWPPSQMVTSLHNLRKRGILSAILRDSLTDLRLVSRMDSRSLKNLIKSQLSSWDRQFLSCMGISLSLVHQDDFQEDVGVLRIGFPFGTQLDLHLLHLYLRCAPPEAPDPFKIPFYPFTRNDWQLDLLPPVAKPFSFEHFDLSCFVLFRLSFRNYPLIIKIQLSGSLSKKVWVNDLCYSPERVDRWRGIPVNPNALRQGSLVDLETLTPLTFTLSPHCEKEILWRTPWRSWLCKNDSEQITSPLSLMSRPRDLTWLRRMMDCDDDNQYQWCVSVFPFEPEHLHSPLHDLSLCLGVIFSPAQSTFWFGCKIIRDETNQWSMGQYLIHPSSHHFDISLLSDPDKFHCCFFWKSLDRLTLLLFHDTRLLLERDLCFPSVTTIKKTQKTP